MMGKREQELGVSEEKDLGLLGTAFGPRRSSTRGTGEFDTFSRLIKISVGA